MINFIGGLIAGVLVTFLWRERTRHESHYKKQMERREGKK